MRADAELRGTPVILLSARAGEEARIEGLGRGADDYLVKPFSARELLVRVGALVKSAAMHRRAAEALAQFETLLNEAPLGVYLVDEDFRIAAVNPVARPAFGDIPDLIGRDFDAVMRVLWPTAYADEVVRIFRHTLETGEPYVVPERVEERLDRKVTEFYEWQINRIPLPGNRRGVVCYFRDISKSVIAREALREADHRKDEFLATLAHELRNPLAPLRSSLEVLKLGGTGGSPVDIMDRQLSHLVRLVDDLMEVSRITRGEVELRKEPVSLDQALRNAVEGSEPLIRAGGHSLSISMPPDPIMLDADPVRLAQIFGNLLNNAAKYSEAGRTDCRRRSARGRRGRGRHQRHGRWHRGRTAAAAVQGVCSRAPERQPESDRAWDRSGPCAAAGRNARRPGRRGEPGRRQRQLLYGAAAGRQSITRASRSTRRGTLLAAIAREEADHEEGERVGRKSQST